MPVPGSSRDARLLTMQSLLTLVKSLIVQGDAARARLFATLLAHKGGRVVGWVAGDVRL